MVRPPTRLGEFELVRELGRGGMGVVYEAVQTSLDRRVALKVLGPGLGLTPRAVDRFRREATAAAKLHHTNIVPVYATGEQDGVPFYAMELIDGPSLDAVIRQLRSQSKQPAPAIAPELAATSAYAPPDPLSTPHPSGPSGGSSADRFDRIAGMVADVADALHHAHSNGVTHRDIKPSNLMVSSTGLLSVTDFGLARMLEQPGMTVTGEFVGTPAYMSPEQVTAGRIPVDHRTDIYSLGATLYEFLTLRPPFAADGRDKLLAMVIQKEPPPPRSVEPKVPRDLETICMKCLEKDPDRRYQSGKELADDLRRFANRFAILAKRAGPLTKIKKWVRRNPALTVAASAVFLAVCSAVFFAWKANESEQQRLADERTRDAELRTERREAAVEKAILEAMSGDAPAALAAIAEAEEKGAEPGRLNLLRGVVEYHRGRPKEAIVYLRQAERQLPASAAVQSLLAQTLSEATQYIEGEAAANTAFQLPATMPEDYLFLGLIQSQMHEATLGLRTLSEAPTRVRNSTVGRLVRGIIQANLAYETGRTEDAERALDELLKADLPADHPLLLRYRLQARMSQALACRATDPARAAAVWEQAARDAEALKAHRDRPDVVLCLCNYYFVRGEYDAVLTTCRQALADKVDTYYTRNTPLSIHYSRNECEVALELLKEYGPENLNLNFFTLSSRGLVLAGMPGKAREAEQCLLEAIEKCPNSTALAFVAGELLHLGPTYLARSRQAALDIRKRAATTIPTWHGGWYHDLLDYHAGVIDADELLRRAGTNRLKLCEGNYAIGLHQLAGRKRSEAKASFQRSVDSNVYFYVEYIWSRAFLARINDPTWPPWVTEKK